MNSAKLLALPMIGFLVLAFLQLSSAQIAPSPAASSDGSAVDQGIAYFLMLLALAITYLIH